MTHRYSLGAEAGGQTLQGGYVFDHDDLLGEVAWLEGLQELAEDIAQAQPGKGVVLPDLLPEGARDAVLEAVGLTWRGRSGTWLAGLAE